MRKPSVLVVDDDPTTLSYLSNFLSTRGYKVDSVDSDKRALERLARPDPPAIVLLDLPLSDRDGLEVLARMEQLDHPVAVIVLSGAGDVNGAVKAMRMGAADYLVKPFDDEELEMAIESARELQPHAPKRVSPETPNGQSELISNNHKVLRMREIAERVADTDAPVLILGETGVGKEVLARFIHSRSGRRNSRMVKINCAALPADLLESELFGYERGAFTGALRDKPGEFEMADNSTILLDEIGEMSAPLQAKLLHVLQDGEYTRLGATRPVKVDARVLASTNKRLEEAVSQGEFRADLFFRLNVIRVEIPPLRERPEDIPMLCRHFFEKFQQKYGTGPQAMPESLIDAFQRYHWPGNIRQLENTIRRFVILPEPDLVLADLQEDLALSDGKPAIAPSLKELSAMAAENAEKEAILRTLGEVGWNRKQAARELNMCYKSLLNKLRRWQISGEPKRTAVHT